MKLFNRMFKTKNDECHRHHCTTGYANSGKLPFLQSPLTRAKHKKYFYFHPIKYKQQALINGTNIF